MERYGHRRGDLFRDGTIVGIHRRCKGQIAPQRRFLVDEVERALEVALQIRPIRERKDGLVKSKPGLAEQAEAPAVAEQPPRQARPEAVPVSRQQLFVGRRRGDGEGIQRIERPAAAPVPTVVEHQRNTTPERQRPSCRVLEELIAHSSAERRCDRIVPAFPEYGGIV